MLIYFIVFTISSLFLFLSENCKKRGIKSTLVICGLFIPVLFAGLRMIGIGTDTAGYVSILFDAAKQSDSYLNYMSTNIISNYQSRTIYSFVEPGYSTLVYFSAKIFGSYQAVLFFSNLPVILLMYFGMERNEIIKSKWLGMLIFYFIYYGSTFNWIRQWIAISVLFFGFSYLLKNQNSRYLLMVGVACLFHYSALVGIVVFGVYWLFSKNEIEPQKMNYRTVLVTILIFICITSIGIISKYIAMVSPVFSRYVNVYLSGNIKIMPMQIVRRIPYLFIFFVEFKRIRKQYKGLSYFILNLIIIDLLLSQLGSLFSQTNRISLYFSVFLLLGYPMIVRMYNRNNRFIVGSFLIAYAVFVFFYDYVLMGRSEIVPYLFYFM